MPITNAGLVEALVQEAMDKNDLNLGAVSGDLNDGEQPYGFAAKQLLVARQGEVEISRDKLKAIAARLSELLNRDIFWQNLVQKEESGQTQDEPAKVEIKGEATDGGIVVNNYQSETHFHQGQSKDD